MKTILDECESCGAYHDSEFDGDCRDDENRYDSPEQCAEREGIDLKDIEVRGIPSDEDYREAASRVWGNDGEIEIDAGAVVSRGNDPGAYVQAWVWVYDKDAREKK